MTTFIVFLVLSYLVGAIPCGVVLTRLAGVGDVRKSGSGNIGATNVYRVGGRRLGVLTLLLDALKGLLPVLVAKAFLDFPEPQVAAVAVAAFLGHCYPVYLGFKGGKGVATALGVLMVLSPMTILVAVLLFAGLLWKWRYVSLGSISAAGAAPFLVLLFEKSQPFFGATLLIAAMVIVRHHENISRLLKGTENRFKA